MLAGHWSVEVAEDGVTALQCVQASIPDLVVLDLSMPRLDGWEVIRALRENPKTRSIPVLACSAHAMRGDQERALAAGFDGYVTKPYRSNELVSSVETFLGPGEPGGEDDGWGGDDWSLDEDEWSDEGGVL